MQFQILAEQIQQLKHKQHIHNITLVKHNQYQVIYSPQLTNSPYSHLTYRIKLIIPEKYPQAPPKIIFEDKIYHLNIEHATGLVKMPIISQDWSPYLTLVTVFDTLDNLLEEPDVNYAVSPIIRQQYTEQPQKYIQKVEQMIRLANQFEQQAGNSVVEHVEVINDSKSNENLSRSQDFHDSNGKFQISNALSDIPKRKLNGESESPQIKVQTQSFISPSFQKKEQFLKPIFLLPEHHEQQEGNLFKKAINMTQKPVLHRQSQNLKIVSKEINDLKQSNLKCQIQFQKMQINLKQTDSLLNLLILQSNTMQQILAKSQNSRVKQMLQNKQQRILQMSEQILELSSQLREKMFATLQASAKSLLK